MMSLAVLFLGVGLAGCGSTNSAGTVDSTSKTTTATSSQVKNKTLEVTDSNGKVTVPKNPKKVVVFDNG